MIVLCPDKTPEGNQNQFKTFSGFHYFTFTNRLFMLLLHEFLEKKLTYVCSKYKPFHCSLKKNSTIEKTILKWVMYVTVFNAVAIKAIP